MKVKSELHAPAALTPRKEPPGIRWTGGCVEPTAGLYTVAKIFIWEQFAEENTWYYERGNDRTEENTYNEEIHNLYSNSNIIRVIK